MRPVLRAELGREPEPSRPTLRPIQSVGPRFRGGGELDERLGALPALLAMGALTLPRFVVLRLKQPAPSCLLESEQVEAFGQRFRLFAVGGGDWELARVEADGSETYLGKTRDLVGWRPSGAPVGGWK